MIGSIVDYNNDGTDNTANSGLHLNTLGYEKLGKTIGFAINKLLHEFPYGELDITNYDLTASQIAIYLDYHVGIPTTGKTINILGNASPDTDSAAFITLSLTNTILYE